MQADDKLGQILIRLKAVDSKVLAVALTEQKRLQIEGGRNFKIGELLVFMQEIDLPKLHQALSLQRTKAQAHRDFALKALKREVHESSEKTNAEGSKNSGLVHKLRSFFSSK